MQFWLVNKRLLTFFVFLCLCFPFYFSLFPVLSLFLLPWQVIKRTTTFVLSMSTLVLVIANGLEWPTGTGACSTSSVRSESESSLSLSRSLSLSLSLSLPPRLLLPCINLFLCLVLSLSTPLLSLKAQD